MIIISFNYVKHYIIEITSPSYWLVLHGMWHNLEGDKHNFEVIDNFV